MNFFKQFRRFFLNSITALLTTVLVFNFATNASLASTPSLVETVNTPLVQLISMNRVEAMGKNIEGKTQEAIGNITGDTKDQLVGKAKQAESKVRNTVEDAKDAVSGGRTKAIQKNAEGKTQEGIGKVTGNRQDQFEGQAKQLESNVRNAVEDVKDSVNGLFN